VRVVVTGRGRGRGLRWSYLLEEGGWRSEREERIGDWR
jgi:hypothetical protein